MLYYFRKQKVWYAIAIIIGFAIIFLLLYTHSVKVNGVYQERNLLPFGVNFYNHTENELFMFLSWFVWYMFCVLFFNHWARMQWNKLNNILLIDCDPPRFINQVLPLGKKQNPSNNIYYEVCISLSSAYLAAGHYNDMKVLLDSVYLANFQVGHRAQVNKIQYWSDLFSYYLDSSNLDECQSLLEQMEQTLWKIRGKDKQHCLYLFNTNKSLYNMELGNYDGAESLLNEIFDSAQNEFERVNTKNTLGGLYQHFGKTQKAREAFTYVAEHGNELAVVFKAREYLKSLVLTR